MTSSQVKRLSVEDVEVSEAAVAKVEEGVAEENSVVVVKAAHVEVVDVLITKEVKDAPLVVLLLPVEVLPTSKSRTRALSQAWGHRLTAKSLNTIFIMVGNLYDNSFGTIEQNLNCAWW